MSDDSLIFDTPIGALEATASNGKITHLAPVSGKAPKRQKESAHQALLTKTAQEVNAFLSGALKKFTVPVFINGSPTQQKVWKELQKIPYGKDISYSEMAERIGNPNAVRAVGSACGANPIPLIIPCHRVLRSDGSLGGFGWGLEVKEFLLAMERGQLKKAA